MGNHALTQNYPHWILITMAKTSSHTYCKWWNTVLVKKPNETLKQPLKWSCHINEHDSLTDRITLRARGAQSKLQSSGKFRVVFSVSEDFSARPIAKLLQLPKRMAANVGMEGPCLTASVARVSHCKRPKLSVWLSESSRASLACQPTHHAESV